MTEVHPSSRAAPHPAAATIAVVILSSFLAPFMGSALNVALPPIGREFTINAVVLGWVVTAYSLSTAVFLLPSGRLGDIRGRRQVFLWGMVVYTAGSLLSAVAPSAPWLIAGRIVHGAGSAMGFASGMAILVSVVPPAGRGRALGWNVAAVYSGLSLGPFLGGLIAQGLGWRWIFIINIAAGVIATALTAWKVPRDAAGAPGARLDIWGSVNYALALLAFMGGLSWLPHLEGVALSGVGVLCLAAFVRWESRCASPIFDVAALRGNRVFAFANAAALVNYSATAAVSFLLSLYLQYVKDLTPSQAGLVLVAQPIVMAVFSPIAGRLSDRIEPRKLASTGMAFSALGLLVFCFLEEGTSLGYVVGGLAVLGLGFGLFSSPNTNAVMSAVPRSHYGAASGILSTMRVVGQMLSMGVVMVILAVCVGRVPLSPSAHAAVLHSVRLAFAGFAALCVLGVFASIVRGSDSSPPGREGA
ncbi:MAG: MFS transporter [Lentisphaerae bacterium]|nr:MFS transporter [Lentisphaerota bacterium]